MPFSQSQANKLTDNFRTSLGMIGKNLKLPKGKGNTAPIAWEFFVSHVLNSYAAARYNAAKREAVKAGVIFNHEKDPLPAGTKQDVYNDGVVRVSVEVRSSYEQVDAKKMAAFLAGKGVKQKDIDDAIAFATTQTKCPHVFRADPVVAD